MKYMMNFIHTTPDHQNMSRHVHAVLGVQVVGVAYINNSLALEVLVPSRHSVIYMVSLNSTIDRPALLQMHMNLWIAAKD